ncbi:Y4yA family PLP-dependent enzyme [Sphingobacterium rhinopitheci]|uniref:Y4yA family PLP-dependent enzyme n=1 Tax=Sphingobacterium rhinopitheci TaxID=2781960 RepID=UPI001F51E236|nr:Y4yA family PLP-dependent enzyme [Sphingobacterium rhinopitheci]MCI0922230.1 Y4yA family PLP-dependent enzyme [Sphingobacterium rhinopitheci]
MSTNQHIQHLPLTPLLHPWIKELIGHPELLLSAIEEHGSPINVHSLAPFGENIQAYQEVFQKFGLKYKIFFARKANKCIVFPLAASKQGQGADTASFRELKQCLDAGIAPKDLILTAAVKNRQLLELAVEHQITVVLDNMDEWDLLQQIVRDKQKEITVNVRLGSFHFEGKTLPTRFGFTSEEAFLFIQKIRKEEPLLRFSGLHFHLNGYSVEQRVTAIEQSLELIDRLYEQGINTESLDIGGGFLMNYLSDKFEWENFHRELKRAVLDEREPITYQNDALGMIKLNNQLYGEPTVYPYYNELHKTDFLKSILTSISSTQQQPLFELLRKRNIELRMEPGRSLLDQCGITVAKVAFRKKDSDGNWLFGLEMNRTQLRSSSADFLLDPIHIPQTENLENTDYCEGYLVGSYCLEQELILKRKLAFSQFPQVGDLLIFPNTAGYMMHFFESEAHLFELAKNLVVVGNVLYFCDGLKI